jgi:neural Wiskott-Aldrich syndrome protein
MSVTAEKSPAPSSAESPPPPVASSNAAATGTDFPSTSEGSNPASVPANAFVMPPGLPQLAGMQFVPYFPPIATGGESGDPNSQPQPQMMIHPAFLSQMYSYSYPGMLAAGLKLKRKQVKNACTNCQKACKKCDDERPCPRCVKYGVADECQDSVRKERRKGIKRGSYKKKGESSFPITGNIYSFFLALPSGENDEAETPTTPFMPAYPAQLYSQWAAAAMSASANAKPGEAPSYYPYFIAAPVAPGEAGASGENAAPTAANPYFSQMYYGAAGYPPGYPMPGFNPEAANAAAAPKQPQKPEESEDELEEEAEEEEEEEEASPKRKSKKKRTASE